MLVVTRQCISLGWRKEVGVEPTRDRLATPTGFEAQPRHRTRFPSRDLPAGFAQVHQQSFHWHELNHNSPLSLPQGVQVFDPPGQADTIKVLENLDRALAANASDIAKSRCRNRAFAGLQQPRMLGQPIERRLTKE